MPDTTPFPSDDQPLDPWLADRLASGPDADVPDALAELVAAAQAPATADELAGEEALRAAFAEHGPLGAMSGAPVPDGEGTSMRSTRLSTKLAAAVAVGALSLAGVGAAALTGSLPGVSQDESAPLALDDPSEEPTAEPTDEPSEEPTTDPSEEPTDDPSEEPGDEGTEDAEGAKKGPDATGPAAFGLCNAWSKGGLSGTSTAYANLVEAAGSEEGIESYCATIEHPGNGGPQGGDSEEPGKKDDNPGKKDDNPGKKDDNPGKKDDNPGKKDSHPGKDDKPDQPAKGKKA